MLQPGVRQVNAMLTATELKVALNTASVQVTALGRQLEEAEVRSEAAGSEIPCDAAADLTEALRVQTSALQGQVHLEERLCTQMEQLSISLDQHRNSQQELLEALQVVAWGFGHGLGPGLGIWTGFSTRQEEWSEGEEDEGQEQRHRWNDTLS